MVLKHGSWHKLWKIELLHLPPTYSVDFLHGPRYQCWCTSPSQLSTAAVAAHPNKTSPLLRACGTDGRLAWPVQGFTYVNSSLAGYPRIGRAAQDVRVTPGFRPWKQTFSRSIMAWTQHGDTPRTEDAGSSLWKRLCSSQGHTHDDDGDHIVLYRTVCNATPKLCNFCLVWFTSE